MSFGIQEKIQFRIWLVLIMLLFFSDILKGQHTIEDPSNSYTFCIPDSLTMNSQNIVQYINAKQNSDNDKVRTAYAWIIKNISYDIDNMYSFNTERNIEITLKNRKGICENYADLFNDILNKMEIESYVVKGYTKDRGVISRSPHAWCVAKIDSVWFVYDPTWGAGELSNNSFESKMNFDFFQLKPETAIKTHMPFDPLWQLLNYPVTYLEFEQGRIKARKNKSLFNYIDSIEKFRLQNDLERFISAKDRIDKNGIDNYLIYVYRIEIEYFIKSYYEQEVKMKYSFALKEYNNGIYLLNRFIDYRNDLFKPDKGDKYLIEMMDGIFTSFDLSKKHLDEIKTPDRTTKEKMDQLYKALQADMQNVNAQKKFLDKILSTSKNYRKSLFYDKM